MPEFLVESYDPQGALHASPTGVPGVLHRRSIFVPADELALHVVTAESAAALRRALDGAAFAYQRVVLAVDEQAAQVHPHGRPTIGRDGDDTSRTTDQAARRPTHNERKQGERPC